MALPVFNTLAEVPEAFRGEYEERDGKAQPKVVAPAEGMTEADRTALKNALDKERRDRETAERERDALKRAKDAKDKGIPEEELQKIRDAEAAERQPIIAERDTLKAENRKLKLTDKVQALFLKHGGMADRVEDAMLILDKRTDLGDQDGIVFKDKAGATTADTPETFFGKFKTERPWLFSGTGGSGSGATGSTGTGGDDDTPKPKERDVELATMVGGAF